MLLLESNIGLELLNENGPAGISIESDTDDVVNLRRGCRKITCRWFLSPSKSLSGPEKTRNEIEKISQLLFFENT